MSAGGNVYDKYATRNPIERRLVDGFLEQVCELSDRTDASEAHEVGCGEGEISMLLARRGMRVRGTDVSAEVIEEARRRSRAAGVDVSYREAPISELRPDRDAAELIVCCEVLEHLDDAEAGLETLADLARPWLLVSVPREPIWRALNLARGKYIRDLGNTPGHLGHWSRRGFVELLRSRVDVVEVRSPLPWTMALCRANGR
jgi:2-polyprenyl-3-methyl-5-hydroxy-6-metoxy-1,4-benzoquinol methylase